MAPALVALGPAAVVWWRGRRLARRIDDPALPERLLAGRHINGLAIGISFGLLVAAWSSTIAWTLPLLFAGRLVAGYPARRILLQETWGLGAYLSFFLRLILAAYAFWFTLSAAPALINAAGPYRWTAAATLAALLVAWHMRYVDIFHGLLRTKPIDDPVLTRAFARLVEVSGIQPPQFARVEMRGGVFANAVAVPSLRRSAVVFTDTLLARLDADEATAICAHEIAHLEHYNARRLRRLAVVSYTLIAFVALTPVFGLMVPALAGAVANVWPAIIILTLAARARHRQQHETASDLRAIALTGDPEALVRGLTKLHVIARMPRRWEAQFERQATHPSLVRRIKAIREAAGSPAAALGDAAAFHAADGASSVVFRDDAVEWNEGDATRHTIAYSHITELRLDAKGTRTPHLVAVDRSGRRWQLPLVDADVGRAQAVMDLVDVRTANPHTPAVSPALGRVLALIMAAAAAMVGHFASVIVALLAIARPAGPLFVAAGLAAFASAGLTLRDHVWRAGDAETPALVIIVSLLGVGLLWMARVNRGDTPSSRVWAVVGMLGAFAAFAWMALLRNGFEVVRLHQAARTWPAAAVFSIAFAAAFAFMRTRHARFGAGAAALIGLFAAAAGSTTFLEAFSHDAFVSPSESFAVRAISPPQLGEFRVPFDAETLRLSPHGRSVAVSTENEDEETTFHVGPAGGRLTAFEVDDAAFIDDDRVLLLEQSATGAILKEVEIGSTSVVVREREMSGLVKATLSFDSGTNTWTVVGRNRENQIVRVIGNTATSAMLQQRWDLPRLLNQRASAISASDRGALIVDTRYQRDPLISTRLRAWAFLLQSGPRTESHLWTVGPQGAAEGATTRLDLRCVETRPMDMALVCAAYDGVRTRIFTVTGDSQHPSAVGWLDGHLHLRDSAARDEVTGWWQDSAVLLRLSSREVLRIAYSAGDHIRAMTATEAVIGAVIPGEDQSIVRVYSRR